MLNYPKWLIFAFETVRVLSDKVVNKKKLAPSKIVVGTELWYKFEYFYVIIVYDDDYQVPVPIMSAHVCDFIGIKLHEMQPDRTLDRYSDTPATLLR